jgi:hypothetical protein
MWGTQSWYNFKLSETWPNQSRYMPEARRQAVIPQEKNHIEGYR